MHRPIDEPTWRGILASYVAVAAIPLLLWAVSRPLAGAVVVATVVALVVGARRTSRLSSRVIDCLSDCQGYAFGLSENVRVTVTWTPVDDPN